MKWIDLFFLSLGGASIVRGALMTFGGFKKMQKRFLGRYERLAELLVSHLASSCANQKRLDSTVENVCTKRTRRN